LKKNSRGQLAEQKLILSYTLGVTKLSELLFLSHFAVLLKSDLDVQQPHLSLAPARLRLSSSLAPAMGVANVYTAEG
jgi:hypothetical protein